jgi:putative colanic acid biosynthesis UDP-glucose lipid carrier transferase
MPAITRLILKSRDFIFLSSVSYSVVKRSLDIVISIILLAVCVFFIPVLIVLVKYKSPGKFLYTQKRGGLNGREFTIYKLRTMYTGMCDEGQKQVAYKDPRVTHNGKWLRCISIDELPQLFNVLIGDMSLVGPRPHAIPMDRYYAEYISFYNDRYQIKPGITGLAQIQDSRGEIKIIQDMERRVWLDIEYMHKKSLWLDLIILLKTAHIIFNTIC